MGISTIGRGAESFPQICALGVLPLLLLVEGCGGAWTGIPGLDTPDGKIFAQRCSACHLQTFGDHGVTHGVPDPRFRTLEEWKKEIARMEGLMREKGLPPLTDQDREAIFRYLALHAER
ncbi:MAG: hypothetical protein NNA31_01755 [Nitrospira sp.]|nr:hypothetical protein [Nitrospira sp.]